MNKLHGKFKYVLYIMGRTRTKKTRKKTRTKKTRKKTRTKNTRKKTRTKKTRKKTRTKNTRKKTRRRMRRSRNKKKAGSHGDAALSLEDIAMKLLEELRQQCHDKEIEVYFDDSIIDLQKKLDEANEMGSPSSATFGPEGEVFGGDPTLRIEGAALRLASLMAAGGGGGLIQRPPPPSRTAVDDGDDPPPVTIIGAGGGGPPPPPRTAAAEGRRRHYQGFGAPPSDDGHYYPHPPGWSGLGGSERLSGE